ncbi:ATPase [Alphaproteobacteria bacterium]|nr:ATPase [Alphaproteobacteria bacterium]
MTPAGVPFVLPSSDLAEAIRQEWDEQKEFIRPDRMGLTQIANTALDRVASRQKEEIADLLRYAGTDLLCHRADGPEELVRLQEERWRPVLDWLREWIGASFIVVRGVMPVDQPKESLAAMEAQLARSDAFHLAGIHLATHALGSLFLAVALAERRFSAAEVFTLSQIDEAYQRSFWGEDEEAKAREERLREDVQTAGRFLTALGR